MRSSIERKKKLQNCCGHTENYFGFGAIAVLSYIHSSNSRNFGSRQGCISWTSRNADYASLHHTWSLFANHLLSSQVRKALRPWAPRKSLQPGTVLILLAGRFRGKRVVLLKNLDQGVLLVTGPFKINGVPLRRVNSRYVIATSYQVDLAGIDESKVNEVAQAQYFIRDKAKDKANEEAFFKQGEKPQV